MMALAIDPADDPAVNPALPPSAIGNSLRSFILDGNGAWLYQIYAMMGDPQTVAQALQHPQQSHRRGLRPVQRRIASRRLPVRRIVRLPAGPVAGAPDRRLQRPVSFRSADRHDRRARVGPLRHRVPLLAHPGGAGESDRYLLRPGLSVRRLRRHAAGIRDARLHAALRTAGAAGAGERLYPARECRALVHRQCAHRRRRHPAVPRRRPLDVGRLGYAAFFSAARPHGPRGHRSAARLPDHFLRCAGRPHRGPQRLDAQRHHVRLQSQLGKHQPSERHRRTVRTVPQGRMAHQGDEQLRQQRPGPDHHLPQHPGAPELVPPPALPPT